MLGGDEQRDEGNGGLCNPTTKSRRCRRPSVKSLLNPCSQWGLPLGKRSENRTELREGEAQDYSLELIGERIFLPILQSPYPFLPGQNGWPVRGCSDPVTSIPFSCFEWVLSVFGSSLQTWNWGP